MPKDRRTLALLIHLVAYAVVVAICAGVNLWLNPAKLWFVWVALGWGIGVAAHGLAVVLRRTGRRERIFIDRRARGFTVHVFAYVAVITLLFVVNLTATPNRWWFYWVALGWGAGVAAHGWLVFGRRRSESDSTQSMASSGSNAIPAPTKKRTTVSKKRKTAPKRSSTTKRTPRKRPKPKT